MKHMEDSRTENTYLIMNKHINGYGRHFGGVLMQWIDEMAGIVAYRHAGTIVTTACVDNLNFKAGAYLGDTVVLIGKLTYEEIAQATKLTVEEVKELDGKKSA